MAARTVEAAQGLEFSYGVLIHFTSSSGLKSRDAILLLSALFFSNTSSSWLTWRDWVHVIELSQFPVPSSME